MNDSPASSGEPSSGIGKLVSLADTFAKLGVGVIALYGAYYLFITEETKQCNSIVQALYKVVQERSYPNDAIQRIVQISDPGNCNFVTKGLAQALAAISEGGRTPPAPTPPQTTVPPEATAPAPTPPQTTVPPEATAPAPTPPPPQTTGPPEATAQEWVAVGLQGGDMNFDLANGRPVPAQIPSGSILKARTQVNVRPGPAAWSKFSPIPLAANQCFEVEETRELKAGDHVQTWARGKRKSC